MRVLDDPTLFAVIVQSKVVWTGVLGVYAFGRRLSSARVFSLVLVAAGASVCAAPKPNTDASKVRTRITGCLLAGGAALLSAILTVACEAVVKRGRASLHWQNLQLYVVGILVTASTLTRPPSLVISYAMGALIVLEACKGLAISLVLKRTDAVVKTLATTLSIPGVAVMERLVVPGVAPMALPMLLGGGAVVLAITAYHEGPDGRDKPFLAAALGLTLFGAASLAVDAGWPRRGSWFRRRRTNLFCDITDLLLRDSSASGCVLLHGHRPRPPPAAKAGAAGSRTRRRPAASPDR